MRRIESASSAADVYSEGVSFVRSYPGALVLAGSSACSVLTTSSDWLLDSSDSTECDSAVIRYRIKGLTHSLARLPAYRRDVHIFGPSPLGYLLA